MNVDETHLTFGKLIEALFQETAKITRNRKARAKLVYLTLLDMQTGGTTVRNQSGVRPTRETQTHFTKRRGD
jgi:hypothetical protein